MGGGIGGSIAALLAGEKAKVMGLVQPLGLEELDLAVTLPSLVSLLAEVDPISEADLAALAAANSDAILGFAEGAAGVAGLDALFNDVVSSAEAITVDTLAADTAALANDLKTGDAILHDLGGIFTPVSSAVAGAAAAASVPGCSFKPKLAAP